MSSESSSAKLRDEFVKEFKKDPSCIVVAPGRVNIIGEHIDYNGYPVLPIAISQSIYLAVAPNGTNTINIVNCANSSFPPFSCAVSHLEDIKKPPKWHDYVLSGLCGVVQKTGINLSGIDILVIGTIPSGQGLSSSSALVSASALAALNHSGVEQGGLSKNELAELCAESEKYVGTQGGGMDQAACLLSKIGCAQLINFKPLRCEPVTLPPGAAFVVASSMVSINKAATSDFNCRVVECRIACHVITKAKGIPREKVSQLAALQESLGESFSGMLSIVEETFHDDTYDLCEVAKVLEMSEETVRKELLSENTQHVTQFHLKKRARHVFSEAMRVHQFKEFCSSWQHMNSTAKSDCEPVLQSLGALMYASHSSASNDYQCSHQRLDQLVEVSKGIAFGARLTGAGWGGCIVALVPEEKVSNYLEHLRKTFYATLDDEKFGEVVFCSPPASGATVQLF